MKQADLLNLIGDATNDRLRELKRLLTFYNYKEKDLEFLHQEILGALSDRAKKRLLKNAALK